MDAPNIDSFRLPFRRYQSFYPIGIAPEDPIAISEEPASPNFDKMKVEAGDVITADSINEMIELIRTLDDRVRKLEKGLEEAQVDASLPRTVLEVEGIGREEAKKLAQNGIVTLGDLASAKPGNVQTILNLEKENEAQRIVSDASSLTGTESGPSLIDLAGVGTQEYIRLIQQGFRRPQDLVDADLDTVSKVLDKDEKTARALMSEASRIALKKES